MKNFYTSCYKQQNCLHQWKGVILFPPMKISNVAVRHSAEEEAREKAETIDRTFCNDTNAGCVLDASTTKDESKDHFEKQIHKATPKL